MIRHKKRKALRLLRPPSPKRRTTRFYEADFMSGASLCGYDENDISSPEQRLFQKELN